jgi:integrase
LNNIYKETNKTYTVQISYKDHEGNSRRRKRRGFKSLNDAKRFLLEQENLKYEGKLGIQKYLCEDVLNKYLDELKYQTKTATYVKKKHIYNKYLVDHIKGLTVESIDSKFVLKYKEFLRGLALHNNHKHTIFSAASSFMNFAVKYDFAKSNPFRYLNDFTRTKRAQATWTIDQLKTFIKASNDPILNSMVWVLYMTGMRKGEYRALTWNDIDLSKGLVKISKTRSFISGYGYQTTKPKTMSSVRDVLIDSFTIEVLKNYKDYCSSYYSFSSEDLLLELNGEEIPNESLRRRFKRTILKSGLSNIRIHDLRHSHATMLFQSDISPLLISRRIGHKDIQTTLNIYTNVQNNDYEGLLNNIEQKIKG